VDEYDRYDGLALAGLIRAGEVSPAEVLDAAIARIEALNPALNAVVLKRYDAARERLGQPLDGPFGGVPFLLKDLGGAQAGVVMSSGSRFFRESRMPLDAEIVRRFHRAGLITLGRTNVPEFGLSVTTEPALFGPCRNPYDPTRIAGGSSGGAAAAVAAGMVPLAHASDGGGSIRIPAACCGLFGLKVTRGRTTMAPYLGESMAGAAVEHVVSRSVRDSAAALDAIAGPAPGDPYFAPPPVRPFLDEVGCEPGRLRVAFTTRAFDGTEVDPLCRQAAEDAAHLLEALGHVVEEGAPTFDVEALNSAFRDLFAVATANGIDQRAASEGRTPEPAGFEAVTWAMVELGRSLSAPRYVGLLNRLNAIARRIAAWFDEVDVLLTPALAAPPLRLGEVDMGSHDFEGYTEHLWRFTPFTYPFNVTGQPAMSVPLFWNGQELPIGVQLVGRYAGEATLFRLAGQLERARPWADRRPALIAAS
jgi:Asp-tRNA(Asn)/Glu-tRNA(Gln) amidotransferase A subunit family amidase